MGLFKPTDSVADRPVGDVSDTSSDEEAQVRAHVKAHAAALEAVAASAAASTAATADDHKAGIAALLQHATRLQQATTAFADGAGDAVPNLKSKKARKQQELEEQAEHQRTVERLRLKQGRGEVLSVEEQTMLAGSIRAAKKAAKKAEKQEKAVASGISSWRTQTGVSGSALQRIKEAELQKKNDKRARREERRAKRATREGGFDNPLGMDDETLESLKSSKSRRKKKGGIRQFWSSSSSSDEEVTAASNEGVEAKLRSAMSTGVDSGGHDGIHTAANLADSDHKVDIEMAQVFDNTNTKIVIVPDRGGTQLLRKEKDKHGQTTFKVVFPPGQVKSTDVNLPMEWDGMSQIHDELIAGNIDPSLYKSTLHWARKAVGQENVNVFSYDWRRDYSEVSEDFVQFLIKLSQKYNGDTVQVIAHGHGGLIAYAALTPDTCHLYHSCIMVGVPFGPNAHDALRLLHYQHPVAKLRRICRSSTMLSFPSSYYHFPDRGTASMWDNVGWIIDAHNQPVQLDFYNIDDWERFGLGPFADGETPLEQKRHIEHCLMAAKTFRRKLTFDPKLQYPDIVCVCGDSEHTCVSPMLDGPKAFNGYDFKTVRWVYGDGRVACEHAVPPKGVRHLVQLSSRPHSQLISDKKALTKASRAISKNKLDKDAVTIFDDTGPTTHADVEAQIRQDHIMFQLSYRDMMDVLDHIETTLGTHDEDPPPLDEVEVVVHGTNSFEHDLSHQTTLNPMFSELGSELLKAEEADPDSADKVDEVGTMIETMMQVCLSAVLPRLMVPLSELCTRGRRSTVVR
jgi:hypothetical protein